MKSIPLLSSLAGLLLPLLTPSAEAQAITTIILEGDTVPGVGTVTLVGGMAVDDTGGVLVHVWTDNPDPDQNAAMVGVSGLPVVKEGQTLADPAGAVIRTFNGGEVQVNPAGTPLFFLGIDPPLPGEEGLYFGIPPELGLLETAACTASSLPPGWSYTALLPGLINDADELCFYTVLDDPSIGGTYDTEAVMVVSTSSGLQTVVSMEGDVLPGQSFPLLSFSWEMLGFNNSGQVLFGGKTAGPAGSNMVLYLDDAKIAQTGDISPFGAVYIQLALDANLNDNGDYVFSCGIDGGAGIVRNGEAFVQTGDTLPAIEPFLLTEFGQPLFIGNDGRVLWFGLWKTPAPVDSRGLFVDFNLLVEEGVTEIGGLLVQELPALDRSFSMSPSGRYIVFEATLEGGLEGAFLIDLGA